MASTWKAAVALAALAATSAAVAQNAASVIANASRTMGVEGLNSVTYYGSAANYNLGQNNNANYPWPRVNVNDYRRTIDFTINAERNRGADRRVFVTTAQLVYGARGEPTVLTFDGTLRYSVDLATGAVVKL